MIFNSVLLRSTHEFEPLDECGQWLLRTAARGERIGNEFH